MFKISRYTESISKLLIDANDNTNTDCKYGNNIVLIQTVCFF